MPSFLFEEETKIFLDGIDGEGFRDVRDRALLEVMYSTGCRVSEHCGMQLNRLNLSADSIRVKGKGVERRLVFLCDSAVQAIKRYLPYRAALMRRLGVEEHNKIFINAKGHPLSTRGAEKIVEKDGFRRHKEASDAAYLQDIAFATHLVAAGADMRVVQGDARAFKHIDDSSVCACRYGAAAPCL